MACPAEKGHSLRSILSVGRSEPDPGDLTIFRVFATCWRQAEKWSAVPAGLSPLLPLSCHFAHAVAYLGQALGPGPHTLRYDTIRLVTGYVPSHFEHVFPLLAQVGILESARVEDAGVVFQVRQGRGNGWALQLPGGSSPSFSSGKRSPANRGAGPVGRPGSRRDRHPYQRSAGATT